LALVVSAIALPDSINPSLILTDFYLAAGPNPVRRTAMFAVAVFAVTFFGGVVIALGVADLVTSLLPHPSDVVKYAFVTAGGVSLLLGGLAIWLRRESLAPRRAGRGKPPKDIGGPVVIVGAGIAGVELLTAFPYFAAISIIVGSNVSAPSKIFVLGIYNIVYILPLIAIPIVCAVMGPEATDFLNRSRDRILTRWPIVVAPLAVVLGIGLTAFGVLRLLGR
jgi:hypothetical protein